VNSDALEGLIVPAPLVTNTIQNVATDITTV
jgi:hypothetical protein